MSKKIGIASLRKRNHRHRGRKKFDHRSSLINQSGTFGGSNILEPGSNILEPQNFIVNIVEKNEEKKVMIKPGFVCHVRFYQMD